MALVKCPECGRDKVSDMAESCPECGYNIKAYYEKVKKDDSQLIISKSEENKTDDKKNKLPKVLFAVIGVVCVIILVCIIIVTSKKKQNGYELISSLKYNMTQDEIHDILGEPYAAYDKSFSVYVGKHVVDSKAFTEFYTIKVNNIEGELKIRYAGGVGDGYQRMYYFEWRANELPNGYDEYNKLADMIKNDMGEPMETKTKNGVYDACSYWPVVNVEGENWCYKIYLGTNRDLIWRFERLYSYDEIDGRLYK